MAVSGIFACLLSNPWNAKAQVSRPVVLPPTKAATTATTGASASTAAPQISNRIQFHGQVPDNQTNYRANPLDLCPNVVDSNGFNYIVQGQPYQFEFESNCQGNSGSTECRYRPNFIWTIRYTTESGNAYTEQWQDQTAGDFSKIRLYMYDRVPGFTTATNGQATQDGGNSQFSAVPYPNAGCLNPPNNTAQPGELIVGVRLECTGYSCGFTEADDDDEIEIRYYNRRPGSITVTNAPAQLCRDASYTLSTGALFDANQYLWSATSGAVVSSNGTTATLSLANVPVSATSVNVTVVSFNSPGRCGSNYSAARTITLPIAQGPAQPQNLSLSNGPCPTTGNDTKTASISPGPQGTIYSWTVSGAGAAILGASEGANLTFVTLTTPQPGQVTITTKAKTSECGGYSSTLLQNFQIGNTALTPPAGIQKIDGFYSPARLWCTDHGNTLSVVNPQPGLSYYMSLSDVVPAESPTLPSNQRTALLQPGVGTPTCDVYILNEFVTSFRINITTVSDCPRASDFRSFIVNINQAINCDADLRTSGPSTGPAGGASADEAPRPVLYPNPTNGIVNIASQGNTRYEWVKILDVQGRVVSESRESNALGVKSFDLKSLPTGLYQVQLFDGKHLVKERLVKQ